MIQYKIQDKYNYYSKISRRKLGRHKFNLINLLEDLLFRFRIKNYSLSLSLIILKLKFPKKINQ